MPWDQSPTNYTTDIQSYYFNRQFYKAIQERSCATGGTLRWPTGHTVWDSGVITGITANTLTDSSKNWAVGGLPPGCTGTSLWVGVTCTHDPNRPLNYDVVIEGGGTDDETMVIHAMITANGTTTLTLGVGNAAGTTADLTDYVTAGIIPSLGSLVGKNYFIVRRGGLVWADFWPNWPNGFPTQAQIAAGDHGKQELWVGVVTAGTTTTLVDAIDRLTNLNSWEFGATQPQAWGGDRWKDRDLLYYGTNNKLRRVSVTTNASATLTFASQAFAPKVGTPYSIVEANARCIPGRIAWPAKVWYSGYQQGYFTHLPDDSIGGINMPETTIYWEDGATIEDCDGIEDPHDAFDIDPRIPPDNVCAALGGDHIYAPDNYKCRRRLQAITESLLNRFLDTTITFNGFASELRPVTTFPPWTFATVLRAAVPANAVTRTITTVNETTHTATLTGGTITLPKRTPLSNATTIMSSIAYAVLSSVGDVLVAGIGTLTSTTFQAPELNAAHNGKKIVLGYGWTRYYPREMHRYYPATVFIVDVDSSDGGAGAIDPAQVVDFAESGCFGVGKWVNRAASTTYLERDGLGFDGPGAETFITGELVRYVGSSYDLPDVGLGPSPDFTTKQEGPGAPDDLPYWDRFYVGRHPPGAQSLIDKAKAGTATAGGIDFLEDSTKHWYQNWYGGGLMRSQTGTATGGSTSTLTIAKPTGADFCWWDPLSGRYPSSPYAQFPIRIHQSRIVSGLPVVTEYRTVIGSTSVGSTTITIGFRGISSPVQAGDTFTIEEPSGDLNRWQKRVLAVTKASTGAVLLFTIRWSDDNRLYFDSLAGSPSVTAGDGYQIVEVPTGSVLKRLVGAWGTTAVGTADPRGATPTFGDDGIFVTPDSGNLPTTCRWFGRAMNGDYSGVQLAELYAVINKLRWTELTSHWVGKGENNSASASQGRFPGANWGPDYPPDGFTNGTNYDDAWSIVMGRWASNWGTFPFPGVFPATDDTPPQANVRSNANSYVDDPNPNGFVPEGQSMDRVYAYAKVTGIPTCLSSQATIYAYAGFNNIDTDPSVLKNFLVEGSGSDWHATYEENTFSAQGTPLIFHKYALVDTMAISNAATRISSVKVGNANTDLPQWQQPPDPVPHRADLSPTGVHSHDASAIIATGYYVLSQLAVIKWDVASGFKYVD